MTLESGKDGIKQFPNRPSKNLCIITYPDVATVCSPVDASHRGETGAGHWTQNPIILYEESDVCFMAGGLSRCRREKSGCYLKVLIEYSGEDIDEFSVCWECRF